MFSTSLHNEDTFYSQFCSDLKSCSQEVIIESPFITSRRMSMLFPIFRRLRQKNVQIYIVTRDPREHDAIYAYQSAAEITALQAIGVTVFFCERGHHRKMAILDRRILWEGSLNILSQTDSIEVMRRIKGRKYALEMLKFSNLEQYLTK